MTDTRYIPPNLLRICVDQTEAYSASGRVYCKLAEGELKFQSCEDLILGADELFDRVGFPQAFQQRRTFRKKKDEIQSYTAKPITFYTDEEIIAKRGKVKTIEVIVETRRSTSWQGIIRDSEGRYIADFEDALQIFSFMLASD